MKDRFHKTALINMMKSLAPQVIDQTSSHCPSIENLAMIEITPEYITGKAGQ